VPRSGTPLNSASAAGTHTAPRLGLLLPPSAVARPHLLQVAIHVNSVAVLHKTTQK
jgi:hypothetical protein